MEDKTFIGVFFCMYGSFGGNGFVRSGERRQPGQGRTAGRDQSTATASISQSAFLGSALTATQLLAGLLTK